MMGVNSAYCDDHFIMYTNTKSLCCSPETKRMYMSLITPKVFNQKFKKNKRKKSQKEEQFSLMNDNKLLHTY